MKVKLFLLSLVIVFIITGCVIRTHVFIQNKTDHDIQIYNTVVYDIPENDSVMKIVMRTNNLYDNYKDNKLTQHYHKTLKSDSLAFLGIIYGKKSKTELADSVGNHFSSTLTVVSNTDTILFNQKEMIKKINETWAKRNSNPSVKLKAYEKNRLIWEFRKPDSTNVMMKD